MSELESESMINDWKKKGDVKKVLYMHDVYEEIFPDIPDEVEKLDISCSSFKEIHKLPKNLKRFTCKRVPIKSLPLPLPEHLEFLDCRMCWDLLPFDIPASVTVLSDMKYYEESIKNEIERKTEDNYEVAKKRIARWIEANKGKKEKNKLDLSELKFAEFPEMPDDIVHLDCSWNRELKSLKGLPKGLKKLECNGFPLKELIGLPEGLEYLHCDESDIEVFDKLPDSIRTIKNTYYYSKLHTIKSLPLNLKELDLRYLRFLDKIECDFPPNLRKLHLQLTWIKTIPRLPDSLRYLDIFHSKLTMPIYFPPKLKYIYND